MDDVADLARRLCETAIERNNRVKELEQGIIAALRERDEDMRPILRKALHGEAR